MRLINKASHILFAGLIIAGPGLPQPASAITAELAKKCRAMALKVYPAQRPGLKTGNAQGQQDYFTKCVEKQGNMDETPAPASVPAPAPDASAPP